MEEQRAHVRMEITIPKLSLVVLIGASGSGKSSFARKLFLPTEILSSDYCRALVSDNENDQTVTNDAFEVLHFIARKRLAAGKLTVIDATNVQSEARKPLVQLARDYHCLPAAIVFDLPEKLCQERNKQRSDRDFGPHVIRQHRMQLRKSLRELKREGFRHIFTLSSEEQVNSVEKIVRVPLWNDKTDEHGPFDIIGDVHGCYDELVELIETLGYQKIQPVSNNHPLSSPYYQHADGRKIVFLGDIVDRGLKVLDSLKLVYNMVQTNNALCVPGNHDMKFMRKLSGKDVQITHGLAETLAEMDALPEEIKKDFQKEARAFLDSLVSHYVLDGGKLVVSHAGLREEMHGRGSGKVREFCLYGETTGETDEFGLPERLNWALEYRGKRTVVYGHTPVPEPEWLNNTVNIDTGCVFGGKLTALRYPENEFVSINAKRTYCEPVRPIDGNRNEGLTVQQIHDDILDADDVLGKRFISTRLQSNITIRQENATAALEVMSRFAVNPKWLIYLPPTMSPSETSEREGYLEYPSEAFAYYRKHGVTKVVCEQKHMGSRAVIVICKEKDVSRKRFGITEESLGIVYTRTGRQFFFDPILEQDFLLRIRDAMSKSGFWDEFATDWACLDCELMPWSAKAQELLRGQYAAVGTAATASLSEVIPLLNKTMLRQGQLAYCGVKGQSAKELDIQSLYSKFQLRKDLIDRYVKAYQEYCWNVNSINDLKIAPFHLLATEGKVFVDMDHQWHMETIAKICPEDKGLLLATPYRIVDLTDDKSIAEGTAWWEALTEGGGEGMVIKPYSYISKGSKGIIQPALKCRGKEYLRIIYGPEYTIEANLKRLRKRGLNTKRSLAIRELALGIEALERFVRREPLRRVHECVFGVLALESEPVDPRL